MGNNGIVRDHLIKHMARPSPGVHEVLRDHLEPVDLRPRGFEIHVVAGTQTDPETEVWQPHPRRGHSIPPPGTRSSG